MPSNLNSQEAGQPNFQILFDRASNLVEQARDTAYRQVNEALVRRNWLLGKLITEEELKGEDRALYGATIIKALSKRLTTIYGKGFDASNLYKFRQFYSMFPSILDSLRLKSFPLLSWTHYRTLIQELNPDARQWYEKEATQQNWSVRTLQRNISSQLLPATLCYTTMTTSSPPNICYTCQPPNNFEQRLNDRNPYFIFNKKRSRIKNNMYLCTQS